MAANGPETKPDAGPDVDPPVRQLHDPVADPLIQSRIHEVPDDPRPFTGEAPRAGLESWLIFLFFAVVYGVVGYFMLTEGRIVDFTSLEHLNEAYMVFWNDPPRLAAIGLEPATFASVALMPFSVIKPFATSLVALPVLTAIATGLLMATLNSLMRRCDIALGLRIVLLVLFGLNPMVVFYASNGDPMMLSMVMLAIALASLVGWGITDQTRHLATAGLAMGFSFMVDFGMILVGAGLAVAFLLVSASRGDEQDKMRSVLLVFLTPVAYALLFWCLLNWVLVDSPFGWITAQTGVIEVNTTGIFHEVTTDFWGSLGDLFQVTLGVAPLALIAGIMLIVFGLMRGDAASWGLLLVGLCVAAAPLLRAVGADQANLLDLSYGLPLAVFAVAAVAWTGKSAEGLSTVAAAVIAVGLIAAVPLGWNAMRDYSYQNQAEAFTRWVDTQESQEGKESIGGYTVGIDPELAMAQYINTHVPKGERAVLVDENYGYGVMITSGRPDNFYDRVDEGEETWQATIDDPFGEVRYMLITTSRAGDQIAKKWPTAAEGGEAGLTPVFRTDRYVLVEVSEQAPPKRGREDRSSGPQRIPNPVTPTSPVNPSGPSLTTPSQGVDTTPTSPVSPPADGGTVEPSNGASSAPALEGE